MEFSSPSIISASYSNCRLGNRAFRPALITASCINGALRSSEKIKVVIASIYLQKTAECARRADLAARLPPALSVKIPPTPALPCHRQAQTSAVPAPGPQRPQPIGGTRAVDAASYSAISPHQPERHDCRMSGSRFPFSAYPKTEKRRNEARRLNRMSRRFDFASARRRDTESACCRMKEPA